MLLFYIYLFSILVISSACTYSGPSEISEPHEEKDENGPETGVIKYSEIGPILRSKLSDAIESVYFCSKEESMKFSRVILDYLNGHDCYCSKDFDDLCCYSYSFLKGLFQGPLEDKYSASILQMHSRLQSLGQVPKSFAENLDIIFGMNYLNEFYLRLFYSFAKRNNLLTKSIIKSIIIVMKLSDSQEKDHCKTRMILLEFNRLFIKIANSAVESFFSHRDERYAQELVKYLVNNPGILSRYFEKRSKLTLSIYNLFRKIIQDNQRSRKQPDTDVLKQHALLTLKSDEYFGSFDNQNENDNRVTFLPFLPTSSFIVPALFFGIVVQIFYYIQPRYS